MWEMFPVRKDDIAKVWPKVWLLIESVLKRDPDSGYNLDRVYAELLEAKMQLWLIWKDEVLVGTGLTRVVLEDGKRVCVIEGLAGELKGSFQFCRERLAQWTKVLGCDKMVIKNARPGWKRIFKEAKIISQKELEV